jgi:hypothetical protein
VIGLAQTAIVNIGRAKRIFTRTPLGGGTRLHAESDFPEYTGREDFGFRCADYTHCAYTTYSAANA